MNMTHEQFTQIYLPLCRKMYALAYTLLRNRNAARDCVQDVYAELWNTNYSGIICRTRDLENPRTRYANNRPPFSTTREKRKERNNKTRES